MKTIKFLLFIFLSLPLGKSCGWAFSQTLTIIPAVTNATCSSDTNGGISVSVSGGTAPYTYKWQPDGQASPIITGLVPGTYSILITDNSGDSTSSFYFVGPMPIVIDTAKRIQNPLCANNGSIVLSVSGGTPAYAYSWNIGKTEAAITELGAGVYSVLVTDANNCSASFSFNLTEIPCFVSPDPYFTPNGDGYNDTWNIANAQYFDNAHLIIFDRWGTRVYEHKGLYEPWDGKSYFGISVPDAVYYYFFYQDKDDKQNNAKSGSVTIIR